MKCALTLDGVEQIPRDRIENYANQRNKIVDEGERDAEVRVGVDKIHGAVNGIDDKGWCRGKVQTWVVGFFTEESKGLSGFERGVYIARYEVWEHTRREDTVFSVWLRPSLRLLDQFL